MRYRIRHRTSYRYASDVFESFNEVRLQPLACVTQTLLDFDLLIEPPATVISFRDYYGNAVHDFGVAVPARRARDRGDERRRDARGRRRAARPGRRRASRTRRPRSGRSRPTRRSQTSSPSSSARARTSSLADESAALAEALLAEDPEATRARLLQPRRRRRARTARVPRRDDERAQLRRRGARRAERRLPGLRARADLAVPPRGPPRPLRQRLPRQRRASRTASHAWVEAYIPPYGWLGVDATLGRTCTGQHVKVSVGRDYADVAVLRGTYQGGGQAELEVEVSCETLGERRCGRAAPRRRRRADRAAGGDPEPRRDAAVPAGSGADAGDGRDDADARRSRSCRRRVCSSGSEDGPPAQQPQQQQQHRSASR